MIYLYIAFGLVSTLFAMSESQTSYYNELLLMKKDGFNSSFLKKESSATLDILDKENCINLAADLKKTDGTFMTIDKHGSFFSTYNRTEIDLNCKQENSKNNSKIHVFNTGDERELIFDVKDIRLNKSNGLLIINNESIHVTVHRKNLNTRVFYIINKRNGKNFILSNRPLKKEMPFPIKDLHKDLLSD